MHGGVLEKHPCMADVDATNVQKSISSRIFFANHANIMSHASDEGRTAPYLQRLAC